MVFFFMSASIESLPFSTKFNYLSPPILQGRRRLRGGASNHYMSSLPLVPSFCITTDRRRRRRSHLLLLIPNAKKKKKKKKRAWWENFFSDDDDEIWSGWRADDVLDSEEEGEEEFEAWKRRAEAISELREAQEDARNAEEANWEDWLPDGNSSSSSRSTSPSSSWDQDWGGEREEEPSTTTSDDDPIGIMRGDKGLLAFIRTSVTGGDDKDDDDDDDLLFEDRVFRYASTNSAKFVAFLILVPWALDFLVHDYVLMPFLGRYVEKVPLAAEMLDVRRHQKLEIVKALKVERARFQLEVEIGQSPPLSDEEVWLELRHKAIELRDEWRLENQRAFANIWSDVVYGISLFILIYANKSKVALLKFTGYKLLNNISDSGKAFLIILITDIFLGYHSESGWQALVETILEHYGLEVDPAAITIFICFVPVIIDACVKLWLFKFLPRLSPNVSNIFREVRRH
ncbi:putative chloroplast envelope membrane protein [Iris pallida]|uniref:Chloroplast envelope membrane protein n=1 Tax=Iris pallida TaxID=29817 RepID=A0AAX6EJA0_IRIPA|nr:putative chloroplast envelope membrane protein [Iris pallida]